jgi:pimeloyl-ACP methyl ester carboxylesterase
MTPAEAMGGFATPVACASVKALDSKTRSVGCRRFAVAPEQFEDRQPKAADEQERSLAMRRTLVVAMLIALCAASLAPASARRQDGSPVASPGAGITETSVDVGGRSLHLACAGTGSPAVIFEPGGPFADGGTALVSLLGPDLAAALGTRFCSYDRAGTGRSDPDPMGVRTFEEAAADLRAVLASPDLACPCVVIGESLGGSIALVALAEDAAGFAGLVLLDSPYPGYIDDFLALAPAGSPDNGPEFQAYNGGANEEQLDVLTGFRQVTPPAQPPAIPIVVVTHGAGNPPPCNWAPPCSAAFPLAEFEAAWQAGQEALAAALGARLVVAEGTGHAIADENPTLVIGLVAEVVAAVRDPSTRATPAS